MASYRSARRVRKCQSDSWVWSMWRRAVPERSEATTGVRPCRAAMVETMAPRVTW